MKRITLVILIGLLAVNVLAQQRRTQSPKATQQRNSSSQKTTQKRRSSYESPGSIHHVFADLGYTPSVSLTYNYKTAKHWGVGIGAQGCYSHPTGAINSQVAKALYGEIRLYIRPEKNNQFFSFFDVGMDFYKGKNWFYWQEGSRIGYALKNHGVYTGLGLGYLRLMKNSRGPFAAFKMIANWFSAYDYSTVNKQEHSRGVQGWGTLVIALGYKF